MKRILGVLVLLIAAGCAAPPPKSEPGFRAMGKSVTTAKSEPGFRALGKSVTTAKSPSDETLGFEIRRRLDLVGPRETAGVIVEVDGGVVTLRGVAPTPTAILRAVGAVQAVAGVKQVRNEIRSGGPAGPSTY